MTSSTEARDEEAQAIAWESSRLRRHSDYQRVYAGSRKQFSQSMTYFVVEQPEAQVDSPARVGLTAGRVLGKAVERNRIKRRMRAVVRRHLGTLPAGLDVILHPRKSVMTVKFEVLDREVGTIFARIAARFSVQPERELDAGGDPKVSTGGDRP